MNEEMFEDDLDTGIPEPEHVSEILDGMSDSLNQVAGTESLTSAQVYLGSVLVANGYVRRNQVGQEGFMGKVGDGFKAAIAYIKKMFTSIWDFFLKRDAPKLLTEAKEEVKEAAEVLKVIETGGSTEQETTKALTNLRKVALALTHEPDVNKSALDQILKEADEAMKASQPEKKKAVLMIGRELPKLNKRSQNTFKKKLGDVTKHLELMSRAYGTILEASQSHPGDELHQALASDAKRFRAEVDTLASRFRNAKDSGSVADMKDCYTLVNQNLDMTEDSYKDLVALKGHLDKALKQIESGDDAEAKKGIPPLKHGLTCIGALARVSKELIAACKSLLKAGNKAFGY